MNSSSTLIAFALAGLTFGAASVANAQQCVKLMAVSSSGERLSMDPLDNTSHEDAMYLSALYEPLVKLNSAFEPVPALAERWESSADAKTWTFHLRRGVKFHNGKEMDAEDVVFSFKRLMDPAMGSAGAAALKALDRNGISAVDKYTVRFVSSGPVAELPIMIRNKYTLIVPAGSKREDLRRKAVGTGPFLQESFTLGAPYNELKRNPNYWRAGLPKAECLRLANVPDATARIAALNSGEGDIIPYVDNVTLASLKSNSKVKISRADGGTSWMLTMWIDTPPFNDVRVRSAMKMVVDRKAMVDLLLLGDGIPGNDSPMPPNSPWAVSSEVPKQDIAGAKKLLAAAGHANGITVDFNITERIAHVAFAQAYAAMAAPAGIKVNIIKHPSQAYGADVVPKVPFKLITWAARPPQEALSVDYRKGAAINGSRWFRDDFDTLLDRASEELDIGKRKALYQQAQLMLVKEGGIIVPYFEPMATAMRSVCTGYTPHPSTVFMDFSTISCGN
jgi:peptide/nickel transport system substrate-binding protein